MSGRDAYEDFAERYDLFFGPYGEPDEAAERFFRHLFEKNGVRSVLDCACGTGRDLPMFYSLGCEVVGSDISAAMLDRARQNLAGVGLSVPLSLIDYRDLPKQFTRSFDAVVCLSTSIAHMPNRREVLRAFRSMKGVLREGGLLVLTQGTSDRQWQEKPRFILAFDGPEITRLFVIDYERQGARYNVVDVLRDQSMVEMKVWSTEYRQMLLRDDQEKLLRQAGFRFVDFYGSYDLEPYDKERSQRLITVARK